tara:strand:- start:9427 stop:9840 length:414 start_codon:yes stop_codon:yes gene_type:complete
MKSEAYTISKMDGDYLKMAVQATSRAFGVDSEDILGKSRVHPLVFARMTAYWLLSICKGYSHSKTGRMFNRDHGAIMNGIKKVELELELDTASKNVNGSWAVNVKQSHESFCRFHKVYIESDIYLAQKETNYAVQPS